MSRILFLTKPHKALPFSIPKSIKVKEEKIVEVAAPEVKPIVIEVEKEVKKESE